MKMALRTQQGFDDDDDEDLKALRLAALQTIKAKATSPPQSAPTPWVAPVISPKAEVPSLPPVAHRPRNDYIRGGMHRGRHMRNPPFIRHRVNPNLIAIVPIKEPSPPPSSASDQSTVKAGKPSLVLNSASPKLVLPQDRYCKTEEVSEEKQPEVPTKFDRFEHSSSESSAEESAEEEEEEEIEEAEEEVTVKTEPVAVKTEPASDPEPDPDVLLVKDEDEDDSLEKLMNEMEEEMATGVIRPLRPVIAVTAKAKAPKAAPAPAPAAAPGTIPAAGRRPRPHKEKGAKRNRAAVVVKLEEQARQQSPDSCSASLPPAAARAPSPSPSARLGAPLLHPSSPGQRHSPPPRSHLHPRSHPRAGSPRPRTRSRSPPRSPAPLLRAHRSRSRSLSPAPARLKLHFSPGRSRSRTRSRSRSHSRSPLPAALRRSPRSPVRSRSPRSRSPRSPPSHRPRSRSPRSPRSPRSRTRSPPRRKYSPAAARAPGSPLPPRRARLTPPALRWASPRRQSISPKFRRQSVSPSGRRLSPGPYRRQRSPSPARLRNQSPPPPAPAAVRRYSPLRRNPSPPPPARRRGGSRSPSPRRRPRLRPLSPAGAGRKASPWSPVRGPAAAGRPSPAAYKRKSPPSPAYARGRRRSDSSPPPPPRRGGLGTSAADADKGLYRASSPPRTRRPLQESRLNNIRRSCSPPGDCPLVRRASPPPSPSPLSLPTTPISPSDKNWSCTSSLSLSPSPERAGEDARRVKSPLRLRKRHPVEFVSGGYGETVAVAGGRAQLAAATAVATAIDDSSRKLKRRKDRSRSKKRARARGAAAAAEESTRVRDKSEPILSMSSSQLSAPSTESSNFSSAWEAANSVLEARRRKFESSVPIESSNKRIRLKKLETDAGCGCPEEEDRPRAPSHPPPPSEPLVLATDDLEELLDLELENAMQLWSDDESNSDNEARFKSAEKVSTVTELPRIRVVPLAKLQGLDCGTKEKQDKGRSRPVSGDEQEHSLHMPMRDVSRKSSRSSRGQEQTNLKEDNPRTEISPPPDTIEQEQKRSKMHMAAADNLDDGEVGDGSKDGDLRAELSRRRAERLTMAGSVHETLPARLVQSAFKDAVGKKNLRRLDRERHGSSKRPDSQKGTEAGDGRRVLVLKSSAVEQQIPSISVTIPKEEKHKRGGSPGSGGKVPIRMRLGLPGGGSSFPEERERPSGGRRRGSRKVKLKRNVLLASPAGEKVMCGSSLSLTLGSMRHSLLCSLPTFLSPICGLVGTWSSVRAQLSHTWKLICSVIATREKHLRRCNSECEICIQGNNSGESLICSIMKFCLEGCPV